MTDEKVQIVIRINLYALLTPKDYQTIFNILFGRRYKTTPEIQTLVKLLAIATRTKMTLKEESTQDSILVFWRYDNLTTNIPTFTSDLLSVYESSDIEYKRLSKDDSYLLIGTNNFKTLSPPEVYYLKKQIEDYLERAKGLGEVKIICKN